MQHSETSTGVVHDIEALAAVAREAGVLTVVDVISSLGAVPYDGDEWGWTSRVGGSQKAFSATPGLAFVSVSERAWEATDTAANPRVLLRLGRLQDSPTTSPTRRTPSPRPSR